MTIEATAGAMAGKKARVAVTISPWVNEPLPNIQGLLCSRDLARLTRRPRWELFGLALIGKFPRKKRYRGRPVGWCRAEVLEWMTRELSVETDCHGRLNAHRRCVRRAPQQGCLPLGCSTSPAHAAYRPRNSNGGRR
jgi:predicted DNA-binding transcriptional regulator AlpA